jgi:hypothetical protein
MILFALCALLVAASGVPGLWLRTGGGKVSSWLLGLGALAGLGAAIPVLAGGWAPRVSCAWIPSAPGSWCRC